MSARNVIYFECFGQPKGQPRPSAFYNRHTGRAGVYDKGTASEWKAIVAAEAMKHRPDAPLYGPVLVSAEFIFARPRSHYRTGRHSDELRDTAPHWHTSKPDRDNCEKALLDAISRCGYWRDDSQVCGGEIRKRYARPGELPGCWVIVKQPDSEVPVP